jgi:hypothetical protein
MEVNQYQKERLENFVKVQSDIKKIEQITETVFLMEYECGAISFYNISKLGKVSIHSYDMIYHKEYKSEIK